MVGLPDPYWGEQVTAVIIPTQPDDRPQIGELEALCRLNLADFKAPRLWYFTREFPWTETGKLQKFKLIQAIQAGLLAPALDQPQKK